MGTINAAFSVITGALDANQAALSVVANNVANANTKGYARETPNWQENPPVVIQGIVVGTGVASAGATAQRDRILEERLDQQQQMASASEARLSALNGIQALFPASSSTSNSTAGDIGSDITRFFNSFASMEADPGNSALREQVLSSASMLAGDISAAASSLNAQHAALDQQAAGVVAQVNALTEAIASLNAQIQSASPEMDAGPLEDQRQQNLNQLSQLIGINQVTTEVNGLSITTVSGELLVSQGQSFQLSTGIVNGATDFFLGGKDITLSLIDGGGQLGGYLTARDRDIPAVLDSLDQLAYGIAAAVNAQNNAGRDLNGSAGADIFGEPMQVEGSAFSIKVALTDPKAIAAAGATGGLGDNSNAVAMANLADAAIVDGVKPINFYSNLVSALGAKIVDVQTENTSQKASLMQLQSQRDALSGVNLNEEASALALLETSYQAASRVFGILNSIMTSALNLGQQTAVS